MDTPTPASEPVEVARCSARYEAELLIGLLEDAGIDAAMTPSLSGYGARALAGPHRILVRRADLAGARDVVAGWLGEDDASS